jgi:hypothetical protein
LYEPSRHSFGAIQFPGTDVLNVNDLGYDNAAAQAIASAGVQADGEKTAQTAGHGSAGSPTSSLSRCADTRERSSTNIYVAAGAG